MKQLDPAVLIAAFETRSGSEPIIAAVIGLVSEPISPWRRRSWASVRGALEDGLTEDGSYTVCWTPTRMMFTRDGDASVRSADDIREVRQLATFPWLETFDPGAILPGETVQEAYERQLEEDTQVAIDAGGRYVTTGAGPWACAASSPTP